MRGKLMIAWTTVASEVEAKELARGAVEAKLVACVQVDGPVKSFYHWEGQIEESLEWRLVFKFLAERVGDLEAYIKKSHPYRVPQWVCVEVDRVGGNYLEWVQASCL